MNRDPDTLYCGNNNNVFIRGMRNPIDKSFDNSYTTLVFTLKNSSNENVAGGVALQMPYVSGSDGDYVGVLPGTVTLTAGQAYTAVVTDTAQTVRWEIPFIAAIRTE